MATCLSRLLRRKTPPEIAVFSTRRSLSTNTASSPSKLRSEYNFISPPSLHPQPPDKSSNFQPKPESRTRKRSKPPYRPPSSLDRPDPQIRSELPFDFRFSYTESNTKVRPIGLREPKYSPFGPGRLDRVWTGVCAPAVDPKVGSPGVDGELEEKRREMRERVQGVPLTNAERKAIVERFQRPKVKMQINLGRDGLTHNMLDVIHNHWKHAEAVRIKCMGVPTVDMKNICAQLEDKTFGKIINRHGGQLILYRGRHYKPSKRPVVPLMLWKPQEPVYPRLIKTTIEGLSIEETKEMRKRGLSVPALTKLAKNGYYGSLVPMVRDSFLSDELLRIDCKGLPRSDYKKIGCKLKDLVPCILVTFEKEQIVIWRGRNYKPAEGGYFLTERESFDNPSDDASDEARGNESADYEQVGAGFDSGDSDDE
ncbi:CRS2-associated factor 1, mitochondrial [Salvia miltiorrhiza]|uniref:CRS2-associated factor 1, mitochondrial n=1 Tax=Salvia miltiorrhiza TaxID=226208 RepID=UPI0025AD2F5E|nr:CRS2-associated factor 1, mitochondrial [Salvia miltiorrhiza]